MIDHSDRPLGKQRARHDPRTLQLADYLDTTLLPPAPKSCNWGEKIRNDGWGMMTALRATQIELVPLAEAVRQLRTVPVEEYERYGVLFG